MPDELVDIALDVTDEGGHVAEVLLSPTIWKFIQSKADVVVCYGPRREGKTVGGVAAILHHAGLYPDAQPIKWAAVRDTWTNLNRTVMETLREGMSKGWWDVEFSVQGTEAVLNQGMARLYLLGMDRPADANRFQGLELGGVWIDEPAPAADLASGVPIDVLAMAMSSLSQSGCRPRVQLTTNPPDEDSWVVQLTEQLAQMGRAELTIETFWIPPGENPHLPVGYRERMRAAFEAAGRPDLIRRLVEGQIGTLTLGEAVAPEFNELIHVAKAPLPADPRWPIFRFWDFGLNPTCIWVHFWLNKYLYILGTRVGENIGVQQLIESEVLPFQRKYGLGIPLDTRIGRDGSRVVVHEDDQGRTLGVSGRQGGFGRGAQAGYVYRDLGDHAGISREQSNSESSAAWTLEAMLKTSFEPGPVEWAIRRDSLRAALSRLVTGQPFILIDPTENRPLIKALRGGWRYPKDSAGKVGDKPIKDVHCSRPQTEILTVEGWKSHEALVLGEAVYAYDLQRDRLDSVPLLAVHRFEGKRELLRFWSPTFDIAVTPEHTLVTGHRWRKGTRLVEARALSASDFLMRGAVERRNKRPWYTDDFVRACAWVFTEGSRRPGGAWHICQSLTSNAPYCEELDSLFARLGGWRVHDYVAKGFSPGSVVRVWRLSGQMADAVSSVLPGKIPSPAFIGRLTNAQRRLFLYEVIRGDGTWEHGECLPPPQSFRRLRDFFVREGQPIVVMREKLAIDALQHLATLSGFRTTLTSRSFQHFHGWGLSLSTRSRWTSVDKLECGQEEAEMVWCPQTALGTWIARDRGRVWVSGNSHPGDALAHGLSILFPIHDVVAEAGRRARTSRQVQEPKSWVGV